MTRHATPMNPSDTVHKTVFRVSGALAPSTKTSHGTPQRKNAFGPLHKKSRFALRELDTSVTIFEFGLTRKR